MILPKESGPVTLAVSTWIEFFRPRLRAAAQGVFDASIPDDAKADVAANGGFGAFLLLPEGSVVASNIESGAISAALLMYLEDEHKRRSAWEASVEERLRQAPFRA